MLRIFLFNWYSTGLLTLYFSKFIWSANKSEHKLDNGLTDLVSVNIINIKWILTKLWPVF